MDTIRFFKESLANFRTTGSVAPSSKRLAKRMVAPITIQSNLTVVELGAGTGAFTKHLLEILPADARLISLEINRAMAEKLAEKLSDDRVTIIIGDATNLRKHLSDFGIDQVDYIVSGLPLGNFPKNIREAIYGEISGVLKPTGAYTQFQYFLANWLEIRKRFNMINISFEWRNIPPAFVYSCRLR